MTPAVCRWPGPADEHEGPLQPVAVANLPALGVTTLDLVYLCAKHVALLEADVPADYAPRRTTDVPTWVVDELVRMKWPIDSRLFDELLAARARADLPPAPPPGLDVGDLGKVLERVLYFSSVPDDVVDRPALAAELAEAAAGYLGRSPAAGPDPVPLDDEAKPGRPPWALVRTAVGYLETLVAGRGPAGLSELDQLRSTIRDELDKLEVSLHDERDLYLGLVYTGMLTELARNGLDKGAISAETYSAVAEISTTIAAALLDYLPPEARP